MSPRSRAPSSSSLRAPPKRRQAIAFLTSAEPKMAGAIDLHTRSKMVGSRESSTNASASSSEKVVSESPSDERCSKPCLRPSTWRYGVRSATFVSAPLFWWVITAMIPVIVTRFPGIAASTRRRSTEQRTERGISPVGTISGGSCSFHCCWSMYLHFSGRIMYGSSGHCASFGWRGRSHLRGSETPAKPARTGICFTSWQPRHCANTDVAFALTRDAEMMMPGIVTTFVTFVDSSWRMVIGLRDELSVIWIGSCSSSTSSKIDIDTAASIAACSKSGRWKAGRSKRSFASPSSYRIRWSTSTSRRKSRVTIASRSAPRYTYRSSSRNERRNSRYLTRTADGEWSSPCAPSPWSEKKTRPWSKSIAARKLRSESHSRGAGEERKPASLGELYESQS